MNKRLLASIGLVLFVCSQVALSAQMDDATTGAMQRTYTQIWDIVGDFSNQISAQLLSGAMLLLGFSIGVRLLQSFLIGMLDDDLVEGVRIFAVTMIQGVILSVILQSWPAVTSTVDRAYNDFVATVGQGAGIETSNGATGAIGQISGAFSQFAGTGFCAFMTSYSDCASENPTGSQSGEAGQDDSGKPVDQGGGDDSYLDKLAKALKDAMEAVKEAGAAAADTAAKIADAFSDPALLIGGFLAGLAALMMFLVALYQFAKVVVILVSYILVGMLYIKIGEAFGVILIAMFPLLPMWSFNLLGVVANGILFAGVATMLAGIFAKMNESILATVVQQGFADGMAALFPFMASMALILTLFLFAIPSIQGLVSSLVSGGGVRFGGAAGMKAMSMGRGITSRVKGFSLRSSSNAG